MTVIILHPTEEGHLISLQKELINDLYVPNRILYSSYPLWLDFPENDGEGKIDLKELSKTIESISFGKLDISDKEIFINFLIKTKNREYTSKLTLVCIHNGPAFSDREIEIIRQKKQPVNQLKIFRLGTVQEEGLHAKSISKSVWCKLK